MNIGTSDHSPELELALKKFEDACNSLQNEQTKLLDLENRRKRLQEDLESLRNEILVEKSHVRSVMDERYKDAIRSTNQENEAGNPVEVHNQIEFPNELEDIKENHGE